jgi:hypothetical protein
MKTWTQLHEMMEQIKKIQNSTNRKKLKLTTLEQNRKNSFANKIQILRKNKCKVIVKYEDLEWPSHCPILHIPLNYVRHNWTLDRKDRGEDFTSSNTIIVAKRTHNLLNLISKEEIQLLVKWLDK